MSKRLPRNNTEYSRDIFDATSKLEELIQGMNYEPFQDDWLTYHAAFSSGKFLLTTAISLPRDTLQ